jgi:hypothetical protein
MLRGILLILFLTPSTWCSRWPRALPRPPAPAPASAAGPGRTAAAGAADRAAYGGAARGIRIMPRMLSHARCPPLYADLSDFGSLKPSDSPQKAASSSAAGTRAGWDLGIDPQELIQTLAASLWSEHAAAPSTRRFALSRLPWIIDYRFRNATEKMLLLGHSDRQIVKLNEDYSVTVQRLRTGRSSFLGWLKPFSDWNRLFRIPSDGPVSSKSADSVSLWRRTNGTWSYTDLGGDRGLLQIDLAVKGPQEGQKEGRAMTPCVLRHEVVVRGPRDPSRHPLALSPCLGRVHRRPFLLPAWTSPLCRACQMCFTSWLPERIRRRDLRARPDVATFVMRLSSSKPKITSSDVL